MEQLNYTEAFLSNDSATISINATEVPDFKPVDPEDQDLSYLFVPFSSLIIIAILTVAVSRLFFIDSNTFFFP